MKTHIKSVYIFLEPVLLTSIMTNFLEKNWFLLGMLAVLILAFAASDWGVLLNPHKITGIIIIAVIFLFSGFSLPSEALTKGIRDLRLHIYVQIFIFLIIPAYFVSTAFPFRQTMNGNLIVGIYALACLPTTISSSIVFTQIAGGNVAAAIFNSALSNILGIFVSPILLTLLIREAGQALPVHELVRILRDLVLMMLLPFAAGQVCHFFLKDFAMKHRKKFTNINSALVLFVLFFAFSQAAGDNTLLLQLKELYVPFTYLAVSNILFVFLSYYGARIAGLNSENAIAVIFLAPQKTLAMGLPLITTYFANKPELLGAAMLPVLFYHPWQLLVAGVVKNLVKGKI